MRIFKNVPDFKDKNSESLSFIVGTNDDEVVSKLENIIGPQPEYDIIMGREN